LDEPRRAEVTKSHVNFVVADTAKWEQAAAFFIDRHSRVEAFVKNASLGFAIPYLDNGQPHDFVPDFIVRLKDPDASPIRLAALEIERSEPPTSTRVRWSSTITGPTKRFPKFRARSCRSRVKSSRSVPARSRSGRQCHGLISAVTGLPARSQ
jgi:hypothetical protein